MNLWRSDGEMKFASDSDLFVNEKDYSFKGSIGAIYQSFDGKDLYFLDKNKALFAGLLLRGYKIKVINKR